MLNEYYTMKSRWNIYGNLPGTITTVSLISSFTSWQFSHPWIYLLPRFRVTANSHSECNYSLIKRHAV